MFQMFGRGQIASLDDPLSTYCTGFSMMTEYNITLRQLAAQVSSLLVVQVSCDTYNLMTITILCVPCARRCLDYQEKHPVVPQTSSTSALPQQLRFLRD